MHIRPATSDDAAQILRIYQHYVETTAISFEEVPPTEAEMADRIETYSQRYGYWVAVDADGKMCGYAYGSPYRPRHAYRFTAEVSVYVDKDMGGQGVGRMLYETLVPDLQKRGFHALIGIVTLPNPASRRLHEAFGFTHIGTTPQVGRKFDTWHDIGIWQRVFD